MLGPGDLYVGRPGMDALCSSLAAAHPGRLLHAWGTRVSSFSPFLTAFPFVGLVVERRVQGLKILAKAVCAHSAPCCVCSLPSTWVSRLRPGGTAQNPARFLWKDGLPGSC